MPILTKDYAALETAPLLTAGNTKLGRTVHAWSIPAGATCPGRTPACATLCYARRGHFRQTRTAALHARNERRRHEPGFAAAMLREIKRQGALVVRIHVAGDFDSAAYARTWLQVARRAPRVRFYAYTRSWRDPEVLPALRELAARPNVDLWFSEDRDSGKSPAVPRVRVAFLVASREDEALVPAHADLVFRDKAHLKLVPALTRQLGGTLVCPHEAAPRSVLPEPVTCAGCKLCFTARLPRRASPEKSQCP